ncbi:MAG: hypothetical protein LBT50_04370 [Prevotellaceae bacterium]|nr:hypothetical protein [Prevotellaceae bacterium]
MRIIVLILVAFFVFGLTAYKRVVKAGKIGRTIVSKVSSILHGTIFPDQFDDRPKLDTWLLCENNLGRLG